MGHNEHTKNQPNNSNYSCIIATLGAQLGYHSFYVIGCIFLCPLVYSHLLNGVYAGKQAMPSLGQYGQFLGEPPLGYGLAGV